MCLLSFYFALWYEEAYDDINDCLQGPVPGQPLQPLMVIMIIYTSAIPGIPFDIAAWMCWGTLLVSLISHLIMWPGDAAGSHPDYPAYEAHWRQLGAQLMRIALFNLFGTFVAIEQTRQMRLNFWHLRLLQEAVQLHRVIRQRFHRYIENTLPAPVVQAIAKGDTGFVRVYEQCTVLQADMVGFTPLSAKFTAEVVLGILSDIFERFDTLGEQNQVDKVKTIGDAYIVCTGALSAPRPDDAERIVRMGLQMQQVVAEIAKEKDIVVAVRIGVHTGRCTGGIIGTVRFHFDMWGAAVQGSVKMEEQGEKFRVHVSDATHALIRARFETEPHLSEDALGEVERRLGIRSSYLIKAEIVKPPRSSEIVRMHDALAPLLDELVVRRRKSSWGSKGRRSSGAKKRQPKLPMQSDQLASWVSRRSLAPAVASGASLGSPPPRLARASASVPESSSSEAIDENDEDRAPSMNFFVGRAATPPKAAASLGVGVAQGASSRKSSIYGSASPRHSTTTPTLARSSQRHPPNRTSGCSCGRSSLAADLSSPPPPPPPPPLPASSHPSAVLGSTGYTNGGGAHAPGEPPVALFSPDGRAIRVVGEDELPPPPPGPPPADSSFVSPRGRSTTSSFRQVASNAHTSSTIAVKESVAAKMQTAADANSAAVRVLFTESVRSSLRRAAFAMTLVLLLFGFYDWVMWANSAVIPFYVMRFVGAAVAAAPTFALAFVGHHLKGTMLPFINLLLLLGPWVCTVFMVFAAPERSPQSNYMLTIALFQLWSGYTMLSLPTAMLGCLQVFFSVIYCVTAWIMLDFPGANQAFRPEYDLDGPDYEIGMTTQDMFDIVIYFVSAHVLGTTHNRRRRRVTRTHAKLLVTQEDRMQVIQREVSGCADLLANIFPAPVLMKLQARGQSLSEGGKRIFAERFDDCTFLFAKIIGLTELIQRGEAGEIEPERVVSALQLVFDRYGQLAGSASDCVRLRLMASDCLLHQVRPTRRYVQSAKDPQDGQ